jgi:arylsulfatase A-like enzyme
MAITSSLDQEGGGGGVSKLFENGRRPNLLFIITDQERAQQHWPASFEQDHLPNLVRLKRQGLSFEQHYTNTCCCSPSRATLLTSLFPDAHGVKRTGSPGPPVPMPLPNDVPNLATFLREQCKYKHVEWHGKWHVGRTPDEYGFEGWQPPDAGNYLTVNETLGGGEPDNDGRFLAEACRFLRQRAEESATASETASANSPDDGDDDKEKQEDDPFCLVVSFVNPHDVYVAQHTVPALGYTAEDFGRVSVPLPSNLTEDTDENNKPRAQGQMSIRYVQFENRPQDYVNFYAHLHELVDSQIGILLNTLDELGLTESTLILRTADHGEQALSHSLVEKFYNVYQESIHIPFVVSNPVAFPRPMTTRALSSHIDIIPTIASLLGMKEQTIVQSWKGKDLSPILNGNAEVFNNTVDGGQGPQPASVQSKIHFTYDDIACPGAPSIIRCIRQHRMKYAVYFTSDGKDADWELYDLDVDPLEDNNLAGNPEYVHIQKHLDSDLYESMVECDTLPKGFDWPPSATRDSRGVPKESR